MTDKNNNAPDALVEKSKTVSAVWLLPVIAAIIGVWLLFTSINDAGVDIVIKVDRADGIAVGKTEIRFKGFSLGVVNDINFTDDLKYVLVKIEIDKSAKDYLNENTQIWLVKPEISLSGVSGLDTVITGNYFEIKPEKGTKSQREFIALKEPPPLGEDNPGLHITLHSKELGSLTHGSSVYYKQIRVGEVYAYKFAEDKSHIKIKIIIEEEYASLVKLNSRFWNASGIQVKGDLSGFKFRTESLASIISGGIAFQTPEDVNDVSGVENFTEFPLYEDYDEARAGINVLMNFESGNGIKAGLTKVIFEGFEVGEVEDISYNQAEGGVTANVIFDPKLEPVLVENMDFWLVKPTISLDGVSNLDRLLSGPYISFRLGDGKPSREFDVLESAPPLDFSEPGLHLKVIANNVDSLTFGSHVFYKNMRVGTIQSNNPTEQPNRFEIDIHIEPEYQHLVNSSTVFYEQSGVEATGSLQSFSLKSGPLESIVTGGIAFTTLDFDNKGSVKNGDEFLLNNNLADALNSEIVEVSTTQNYNLVPGLTVLKFGDKKIGLVRKVTPSDDLQSSIVTIGYRPEFKNLFKDSTKIWVVEPTLGTGNADGFNALLTGTFLEVKAGVGQSRYLFELLDKAPIKDAIDRGLQLHLTADDAGSLSKGSAVTYKKMLIGEVDAINFTDDKLNIDVALTIYEDYRHLISTTTRFYTGSGFDVKGDLTGLSIKTQSLQSIIRGGIAIDNQRADFSNLAAELQSFRLFNSLEDLDNSGRLVTVIFDQVIEIKRNAKVQYHGHNVGYVKDVDLSANLSSTTLKVHLNDKYADLAKANTQFWLIQPEIKSTRVKNPKAFFIGNYLGVMPGNGAEQNHFNGLLKKPVVKRLQKGLNLTLTAPRSGSIIQGNPVYYRQVEVGEVLGIALNEQSNGVQIYVNIYEEHSHLVNTGSKFFNISGFSVEAGLFSGLEFNTDSMDSVLNGGIAFVTPGYDSNKPSYEKANQGATFSLYEKAKEEWLKWNAQLAN